MERMKKLDENIQTAQNLLSGIIERCYELEEENKKLREELEKLKSTYVYDAKQVRDVC